MRIFRLFFADMSSGFAARCLEYNCSLCNQAAVWQTRQCSMERIRSYRDRPEESWELRRSGPGRALIESSDSTWAELRPMCRISPANSSADLRPKLPECEFVRR